MGTIAQKLQRCLDTKEAIKNAIIAKGVSVLESDTFYSYANKISQIETEPTLITKTITENGTYTASTDNADGYSSVVVDVASSGGSNMKAFIDAVDAKQLFYNKQTMTDAQLALIFQPSDLENATTLYYTFWQCHALTTLNLGSYTSNVTDLNYAFYYCKGLTSLVLDTSKVTNMSSAFYRCSGLTSLTLNTSKVIYMQSAFSHCSNLTSLVLDTSNVENMSYTFNQCSGLTSLTLNTSKVTNMQSAFRECTSLTSITLSDCSKVTNASGAFLNSTNLETLRVPNIKVNFNIASSTKWTADALAVILNDLATVTTTQTLTMGSTNLAKLSDEQKAIATGKGWTLA